jgi:cob(I)alamin adenosyltransferase
VVYLNRIYTKTGDGGETSLGDGSRVPKSDLRIVAYGTVDELNSVLGLARAEATDGNIDAALRRIQNDLFDLGADLCVPETASVKDPLRVTPEMVAALEAWIDRANERLQPLQSFVLPGGTHPAAHLHHARTVCRRAEIAVLQLAARDPVNSQVAIYLNRLADLLFVLARSANDNGLADILWVPGGGGRAQTS